MVDVVDVYSMIDVFSVVGVYCCVHRESCVVGMFSEGDVFSVIGVYCVFIQSLAWLVCLVQLMCSLWLMCSQWLLCSPWLMCSQRECETLSSMNCVMLRCGSSTESTMATALSGSTGKCCPTSRQICRSICHSLICPGD